MKTHGQQDSALYVRLQWKGRRKWVRVGTLHMRVGQSAPRAGAPVGTDYLLTSNRTIGASFEPDLIEVLNEHGVWITRHSRGDPYAPYSEGFPAWVFERSMVKVHDKPPVYESQWKHNIPPPSWKQIYESDPDGDILPVGKNWIPPEA